MLNENKANNRQSLTENKWFLISLLLLIMLALAPGIVYMIKFGGGDFSNNNLEWSQFGTFLSGTLSPVIALTGAVLTFTLGFVSYRHNKTLLEKQSRERRPFVNVSYRDFSNEVSISLHNKGVGPLIITKYSVRNEISGITKSSIYEFIEDLPFSFGNYTGDQTNVVLKDGETKNLLRLAGDLADTEFVKNRNSLRKLLGDLIITIDYNDIYDTPMPTYLKSLSWFKRER